MRNMSTLPVPYIPFLGKGTHHRSAQSLMFIFSIYRLSKLELRWKVWGRPQKVGVLWTGSGSDQVPGTKTGEFVDGPRKTTTPQALPQGNRWR